MSALRIDRNTINEPARITARLKYRIFEQNLRYNLNLQYQMQIRHRQSFNSARQAQGFMPHNPNPPTAIWVRCDPHIHPQILTRFRIFPFSLEEQDQHQNMSPQPNSLVGYEVRKLN